ncbi:hypothetical protein ACQ4PT_050706 [Festuca glaucescens]
MMPYSGDRRPSPPPQPHATLSYLSPSATPFTVSRPRDATPDPIPNAPTNPSPYPELPTAPSLYDSWVEPPASYMDLEAGATPGFRGFANSDGFLVSGNAQKNMYSGNHFVDPPDLHQSKKLSEFSANNSVLLPKRHGTSNPENDLCVPDYPYYLSAFSLPSGCRKSEGHDDKQPSNVGDLKESEHALVQSVIQNLSSLNSMISKASFKSDDVTSNCCQMKSEKIKCNRKNHQPEEFAGFDWENIGTDFKTVILQDLAKLPEENLDGDTKDAQMMVYKNLWIEAEASTCKLKYELQLVRMKLAMKNHSQQTAIAPTDSLGEAKASNLCKPENSLCTGESDDSSKQQNPVKESHIHNATLLPQRGDADVFARLKVLKIRDERINCFHEANSELQTERSKYNMADAVDDTVFDNGVDARINSLVEDIIKERPESSSSEGDEADGPTTAALNVFLSCSNNASSLDKDTNMDQLESSESKTHGAFMAKLKDLMSCSDDLSSSSEVNACQLQTSSEHESSQFGQLEDGVMARLQVLKRRIDNTSSMEGQEVVFDPDDWLGHFERKPFGRGAHDELIEKTGMSDDAEFRALSDEADRNTTTQYVGSLLEVCHVPSAPAEPATVHLHDERLSHSPSEWEHVLKEDFFLPGNPLK